MREILALLFCFFLLIPSTFSQNPIFTQDAIHHPVMAKNGMVATQHPIASQVGLEILKKGGNAVDAAVAVGFTLAVVLPRAGNLGGGGFMLVHLKDQNQTIAINYRETAPLASKENMYLKSDGDVDTDLFNKSYLSIGIPGTVAGLCEAHEKYGSMSLKELIKPAIRLAKKGFKVSFDFERVMGKYESRLKISEASKKKFFHPDGRLYKAGDNFKQPDLAWSLKQIAKHGKKGFYNGPITERICSDVQANGGILTLEDFNNYEVQFTSAVEGDYRDHKILSMPPPSSGGIHVIQMLNILEGFDLEKLGHNTAQYIHILVETMKRAYADRSFYLGDPLFHEVPMDQLISKEYADELRKQISLENATPSTEIKPGKLDDYESEETTHFSIVDKDGNVVANTYTLNFSFGTGIVASGTGILLNNEMGDFTAKPGAVDAYGLVGGKANSIVAGKRPLSSMTPVIVLKNNAPYIITGSPGGSRIITSVLQILINVIDHKMNIAEATNAARIHHQWYPDILYFEKSLNSDTRILLKAKGQNLKQRDAMGSTQSIMILDGLLYGSSDPRRPDAFTIGY